ncbi:MAG: hypothetical protein LCH85_01320 [Chloroflexi bacterium]|nr:hypothetical protein [Chloroflexota bacterium]
MGAFNELICTIPCQVCGSISTFVLQFTYGDVWLYRYHLQEPLRWGGNDEGKPGKAHVVAMAISNECPICHTDDMDYVIHLYHDILSSVEPDRGQYQWTHDGYFLVLVP